MKHISQGLRLLTTAALVLLPALGYAAGGTAKSVAPKAIAIASKWNADAILTAASTLDAKADGTAQTWSFSFYSPKAKKNYIVDVRDGKTSGHEVRAYATDPVGSFIDSDKAMAAAKQNGMKTKKKVPMAVRALGAGKDAAAYWTVGTALGPGEVAVVLEAKTGALFTKDEGK